VLLIARASFGAFRRQFRLSNPGTVRRVIAMSGYDLRQ
jgi:hypothetical protein